MNTAIRAETKRHEFDKKAEKRTWRESGLVDSD